MVESILNHHGRKDQIGMSDFHRETALHQYPLDEFSWSDLTFIEGATAVIWGEEKPPEVNEKETLGAIFFWELQFSFHNKATQ